MKETNKPNLDVLEIHHEQWKLNPVTVELLRIINAREQNYIEAIVNESTNFSDQADIRIRLWSGQLKELKQIKKLIYDTETFIAQSRRG